MVVDTSALVAILLGELEAEQFIECLADEPDPLISAATLVEVSRVLEVKLGRGGVRDLDELLHTAQVRTVAVDERQALIARDALERYGAGKHRLNFGDAFAYALAKAKSRPLLYKGEDFAATDVEAADVRAGR